jgi:uncharacterized protein
MTTLDPAALTTAALVERLALLPHPEGGYFRETHRAADRLPAAALPSRFGGDRAASTAIYFLIPRDGFSALHRIQSDEVWHFYLGSPLEILCLGEDGSRRDLHLGIDLAAGQLPQHVVPAGTWFGARTSGSGPHSLVGCTVAPGFDFADFELASRAGLSERFPQHAALIATLTRA